MALVTYLPPADRLCEPSPGTLRITLSNSDQGRHLHGTLRGHCEADLVIGSDGTTIVVAGKRDREPRRAPPCGCVAERVRRRLRRA